MASRWSLRRQIFHNHIKNVEVHSSIEATSGEQEEELPPHLRPGIPVTDLDAPLVEPKTNNGSSSTNTVRSQHPTHTSHHHNGQRIPLNRPGTPYTEIDESKSTCRQKDPPQVFLFPSIKKKHSEASNRISLPCSPIPHRRGLHNPTPLGSICEEDGIKPLPMSPASLVLTSTPGPKGDVGRATASSNVPVEASILNESSMCRICHEDATKEELISPCHCMGTMGMLHLSCLEKWLGSSNTTKCEICQFQFTVERKARPIRWFFHEPSLHDERCQILRSIIFAVVLGLVTIAVVVVCVIWAWKYSNDGRTLQATSLILVATIIVIFYCAVLWFIARRIYHQYNMWRRQHRVIQIQQQPSVYVRNTGYKLFQRLSYKLRRRSKDLDDVPLQRADNVDDIHSLEALGDNSLESYKAAMLRPVMSSLPDVNNNKVTVLHEIEEETGPIKFYQPPSPGATRSFRIEETDKLLRETGV